MLIEAAVSVAVALVAALILSTVRPLREALGRFTRRVLRRSREPDRSESDRAEPTPSETPADPPADQTPLVVVRDWLKLIDQLNDLIDEGDRAMEAHGRPEADYAVGPGGLPPGIEPPRLGRVTAMLAFGNDWSPRVLSVLNDYPEYVSDFKSLGSSIYDAKDTNGDKVPVSVAQVDAQLRRLRGIISDVRTTRL